MFSAILILLFLFVLTGCRAAEVDSPYHLLHEYNPRTAYFPDQKWSKLASPELANWSIVKLELARQYAEEIHSSTVVVVDNGVIVADWGEVTSRYRLHSLRKSLMDVMFGIGVAEHKLNISSTLQDLGIDDIGRLSDTEKQATVHDLLTSRSGVYHPAAYETAEMRRKRPARGSHQPGSFWYYNNWDFNVLVSIFNQQTGEDFFTAFAERIARPLQMQQFSLDDTAYDYDPEYSEHPAYRFRMSGLDLARFGLLCLRQGQWRDKQLVPARWFDESTRPYTVFNSKHPERGYGYLWWLDEGVFYGSGRGGQRLFIVPDLNLVIVHQVNTDKKIRVKSGPIWKLFDMIVTARTTAATHAAVAENDVAESRSAQIPLEERD